MTSGWTRRRFLQGAVAAGATATAAACGLGGAAQSGGAKHVNWAVSASSNAEVDLVKKVAQAYMSKHKDVTVDVLAYPGNPSTAYEQKLLSDITAGTLPDIFVNADIFTKPFFQHGLTADLRPMADKHSFDLGKFNKQFLSLAEDGNKVGFLPRAADVVVLYYNKRLFDEGGVRYPTPDWTWQDLLDASQKLTRKGSNGSVEQWGYTASYDWWAVWVPMVAAEGGQTLSGDRKKAVFNSPEGVRAWDVQFTGLRNGWFTPPSTQTAMGSASAPFQAGKAAMTLTIRGACPDFRQQLKDDWDVQLVPKGSADRKSGMGTMGYGMSAKSRNADAAWDVLQFTYTEGMKVFMESYLLVPPITSFYNDPTWRKLAPPPHNNAVFVDALDHAMLPPPLPFYTTGAFNQSVTDGISAVLLGKMSTQQAVDKMAQAATQALSS